MGRSRTQKKLIKLMQDPRRFVRDSSIARGALELLGQSVEAETIGFEVRADERDLKPRDRPLTASDIKTHIANRATVFFIDDDSQDFVSACALDNEFPALIESILTLCAEESLRLSYVREDMLVAPASIRSATTALMEKPWTVLRLTDKRSSLAFFLEIQSWKDHGDHILAPKPNYTSQRVWTRDLEQHDLPRKGSVGHLNELLASPLEQEVQFDVDFVFTWVDSHDPEWQKMYAAHRPGASTDATSMSRFFNRNELMFALRALDANAPWIRKVHIASNCRPPRWLNVDHPRIEWVPHEEIFDAKYLPTFSSHAIETRLHKIPGLTNHFVYSNDDFLITRASKKSDFFESNGLCRLKLEDWGGVVGEAAEGEPDYLNGARNSQRLIERDFGVSPTQLHCHAPQALRVDILEEMEARYGDAFVRTMEAKFRKVTDVAVTGFFFHHYAYVTGRALKGNEPTMLIQQNHNYAKKYQQIAAERESADVQKRHLSICVNDGADSHLNQRWNRLTSSFLQNYFSEKSCFER